jgi:hypothetical protein
VPRQQVDVRSRCVAGEEEGAALNRWGLRAAFAETRDGRAGVVAEDANAAPEVRPLEGGLKAEGATERFPM